MTPDQRAAIRARLDAATPGPWGGHLSRGAIYAVDENGDRRRRGQRPVGDEYPLVARVGVGHDAALIANAPADLAALLAYVAQLEGLLRDLCHDSLAAAEVLRLREVVGEIAAACERRKTGGYLLAPDDIARHLRAALTPPDKE